MDGEPDVIAINEGEVKSLTTKRDLFNVAVKKIRAYFPLAVNGQITDDSPVQSVKVVSSL